jgi:hypothetical protein
MKNLLSNWKTTSAGVTMILGALVHLGFQIKAHTVDENAVMTAVVALVAGVGLVAAGDAGQSVSKEEADTTFIKKPTGAAGSPADAAPKP